MLETRKADGAVTLYICILEALWLNLGSNIDNPG
jgi:hypothetical protein